MSESTIKEISINGEFYVPKSQQKATGPLSIVRTQSAGVHVGRVVKIEGATVELADSVRIWRWRGANTLNEVAMNGVNTEQYTRISQPVTSILLIGAIEVIPVAEGVTFPPVWND